MGAPFLGGVGGWEAGLAGCRHLRRGDGRHSTAAHEPRWFVAAYKWSCRHLQRAHGPRGLVAAYKAAPGPTGLVVGRGGLGGLAGGLAGSRQQAPRAQFSLLPQFLALAAAQ